MGHSIAEHPLPGIAAGRQKRLADAGILTLEDLIDAGEATLASIPHIHSSLATAAIAAAQERLAQLSGEEPEPAPEPEPVAEPEPEPESVSADAPAADSEPKPKKAKKSKKPKKKASKSKPKKVKKKKSSRVGGAAVKELKSARGLADAAREHARGGKGTPKRRARRAFSKLGEALKGAQSKAGKKGIKRKRWASLRAELASLEKRLRSLLRKKPSEARLKAARKQARRARRAAEDV